MALEGGDTPHCHLPTICHRGHFSERGVWVPARRGCPSHSAPNDKRPLLSTKRNVARSNGRAGMETDVSQLQLARR